MRHHLSPADVGVLEKLTEEEVIDACVRLGVPIMHGRIDRVLFHQALQAEQVSRQPVQGRQ